MGHAAFQTAEKSPSRSPGRSSIHGPMIMRQAVPASRDILQPKADRCACGGGCPRCRSPLSGGATAPAASAAQADSRPKLAQRLFGHWAKPVDVSGPTFNACGTNPFFRWAVDFKHNLDIGYIVQRIETASTPKTAMARRTLGRSRRRSTGSAGTSSTAGLRRRRTS